MTDVRQRERGESSLEWKIDGEGDEPDDGPTDIIRKGHAEVCAWVVIIINRTQEPAVASSASGSMTISMKANRRRSASTRTNSLRASTSSCSGLSIG